MPKVRYKPEEIATKLRQVDVPASQGNNVVDAIREIETRRSAPRSPVSSLSQNTVSFATESASTVRLEIDLYCSFAIPQLPTYRLSLWAMMSASMLPPTLAAETFSVSRARWA